MFTKVRDTKTNVETSFRTQQYSTGCYVIENDNPARQYGVDIDEEQFHKLIRAERGLEVIAVE